MDCTCYVSFTVESEAKDRVIEYLTIVNANAALKSVLAIYDARISNVKCVEDSIRFSLNPDDYPDEIYETVFEFLENNNCKNIGVKEQSEFGTRVIEYSKGSLNIISNLPIDVDESEIGDESGSEPQLQVVDLGSEPYSSVTAVLKSRLQKLPEYISPNSILGLNPTVFINILDKLRQKSKNEGVDTSLVHGTKSNQIELQAYAKNDSESCECVFIEFKKIYKTWPDVKALSQAIDERFQQLGIKRIPRSSRAYLKEFFGVWEWVENNYVVYFHLQSNGGTSSDFELRLGIRLPRSLESVPEKYITNDSVMELTDWILKGQVIYERNLWIESVKKVGGERDIGQERVEAYVQNWGIKVS